MIVKDHQVAMMQPGGKLKFVESGVWTAVMNIDHPGWCVPAAQFNHLSNALNLVNLPLELHIDRLLGSRCRRRCLSIALCCGRLAYGCRLLSGRGTGLRNLPPSLKGHQESENRHQQQPRSGLDQCTPALPAYCSQQPECHSYFAPLNAIAKLAPGRRFMFSSVEYSIVCPAAARLALQR